MNGSEPLDPRIQEQLDRYLRDKEARDQLTRDVSDFMQRTQPREQPPENHRQKVVTRDTTIGNVSRGTQMGRQPETQTAGGKPDASTTGGGGGGGGGGSLTVQGESGSVASVTDVTFETETDLAQITASGASDAALVKFPKHKYFVVHDGVLKEREFLVAGDETDPP